MKKTDNQINDKEKIIKGLEKAYQKMIAYKKSIGGEIAIIKDNEIVVVKPE